MLLDRSKAGFREKDAQRGADGKRRDFEKKVSSRRRASGEKEEKHPLNAPSLSLSTPVNRVTTLQRKLVYKNRGIKLNTKAEKSIKAQILFSFFFLFLRNHINTRRPRPLSRQSSSPPSPPRQ